MPWIGGARGGRFYGFVRGKRGKGRILWASEWVIRLAACVSHKSVPTSGLSPLTTLLEPRFEQLWTDWLTDCHLLLSLSLFALFALRSVFVPYQLPFALLPLTKNLWVETLSDRHVVPSREFNRLSLLCALFAPKGLGSRDLELWCRRVS